MLIPMRLAYSFSKPFQCQHQDALDDCSLQSSALALQCCPNLPHRSILHRCNSQNQKTSKGGCSLAHS